MFELDAFLNVAGQDLNGGFFGTSAQLSIDPLPAGLDFAFTPSLSADATDLTLTTASSMNLPSRQGPWAWSAALRWMIRP
ncbi:MAG: hypothetical protein M3Z21_01305 [Pseudomonadota bacterium]|nr:hypothetical protein [Pseudomonadota bacterium]